MIYGFDTETDNNGERAWVVQWALVDQKGKADIGRTVDEFIDRLRRMFDRSPKHDYIYIHNIDYDWWFIMDAVSEFCSNNSVTLTPVMRNNRIISMDLEASEDSEYEGRITFRDSAKKIPGSKLQDLGRMIGLPKLEGVSEDFHPGWSEEVDFSDPKRWEYVIRDAEIVARAMHRLHAGGKKKSTASGDAWSLMKKFIGTNEKGERFKDDLRWQKLFPILPSELDIHLRKGYMGGLNMSFGRGVNIAEECAGGCITHEDVHSMYPTVMSYDPLPYGEPTVDFKPPAEGVLYIVECCIKLQLKEGLLPWFQFKTGLDYQMEGIPFGTPIEATYQWHEMTLTNVDLDVLMDWYDVEFNPDYCNLYHIFLSKTGVFRGYIEKYMKEKESAEKGSLEYTSAKLAMNSGYGRMALSREQIETKLQKGQRLNDDGEMESFYYFTNEMHISEETENYLPYAMFVTAYARARLLENVMQCLKEGKRVFHCDTDSVIHEGLESEEMDHSDELGGWGIEARPQVLIEGGFKRYIELLNVPPTCLKDFSMACAGVPQRVNHLGVPVGMWVELLDDPRLIYDGVVLGQEDYRIKSEWLRDLYIENGMDPDHVDTRKLLPKHVPGGIILEPHSHKLSDNLQMRLRRVF